MPITTSWPQIDAAFSLSELKDCARNVGTRCSGLKKEIGMELRHLTVRAIRNAVERQRGFGDRQPLQQQVLVVRPPKHALVPFHPYGGGGCRSVVESFPLNSGAGCFKRTITHRKDGGFQFTGTIKTPGGSTSVIHRPKPGSVRQRGPPYSIAEQHALAACLSQRGGRSLGRKPLLMTPAFHSCHPRGRIVELNSDQEEEDHEDF
ncbi:hypothetical protein HDU90_004322 [Geranomyces variabilis]|nr:hypothetical protein HDU90_004322 [Geranomyces variabilis]